MTGDDFRAAIETLWPERGGQNRAAEYFDVGSSRIREWMRGARPIPAGIVRDITQLVERFPRGFEHVDLRDAIATLHRQKTAEGMDAGDAAAAILGAAVALARREIGADGVARLLAD